jgi:flagella basal body P-ring formation protein FlgA
VNTLEDLRQEQSDLQSSDLNKAGLRIYLPREVKVKGDSIALASVGIMRGEKGLVGKAGRVDLGKFSITGQQIKIDRNTILSRLASEGIKARDVEFGGAEVVMVKRDEVVISGKRFSEVARQYLMNMIETEAISEISLIGRQKDWALPEGSDEVKLVPKMNRYSTKSKAKIWIGVVQNDVEVGGCEVAFNLKYKCRRAVALVNIRSGDIINSENIRIVTEQASSPESADWIPPYGMIAKRRIRQGAAVTKNCVRPVEAPVVINRRQMVVVKIETPGLSISALGEAQSDGKVGEYVKVRMGTSRNSRQIVAEVKPNGILVPVY